MEKTIFNIFLSRVNIRKITTITTIWNETLLFIGFFVVNDVVNPVVTLL